MKKTLPTEAIANELAGSSSFFQKPKKQTETHSSPPRKRKSVKNNIGVNPKLNQAIKQTQKDEKMHDSKQSEQESQVVRDNGGSQDNTHASYQASTIERIRKVVKDNGREVTYVRLSPEEKQLVKDLVYTYGRMGIKTSENEIVRIALNYILEDYQESGKESVLEKVIEALNA